MFNARRLSLARKRRGMTKVRLAALTGLSERILTAYESGENAPSDETLGLLARALGMPVEFFEGPDVESPSPDGASFRARTSMTASQRDAALAAGALAVELSDWINQRFELPQPNVPNMRYVEDAEEKVDSGGAEAAAIAVRTEWKLGERPIRNMVHLLEAHGVRVFSLAEECKEVDAFSWWHGDLPFVFLNGMKSAEHSRFDAAHELGHLVLHRHGEPHGRQAELEANRFASAFLMPRGSVLAAAPRHPTLRHLIQLKHQWNVSLAALVYRLHTVGVLSEWQYRQLYIELSEKGYRTTEPEPSARETSQVLNKVFAALRQEGTSKADVARHLRMPPRELDALVFGLVMTVVDGGAGGGGRARSHLRVV